MSSILDSLRLSEVWDQIISLLQNPYSNLPAALLLMAVIVIFVLLVASVVIALVSGSSRRRHQEDLAELAQLVALLEVMDATEDVAPAETPAVRIEREPLPQRLLLWVAGAMAVGILLLVAIGITTSSSAACLGCHEVTPHSEVVSAGGRDPHEGVACVRCHEPSGRVGSVTIAAVGRVNHFFQGVLEQPDAADYGEVRSSACTACHDRAIQQVTEDEARGVRMSHREPREAGAECLDCHTLGTGVVSAVTVGMTPCLRCHDGQAQSTECGTCHTKDVSAATRPQKSPASMQGRVLVSTPDCGGCHEQETQCDPCHGGVRMPHSEEFRWWGHAREGAKDLWFNNGEKCSRCHTEKRHPCTRCHSFFPGHPTDSWPSEHGVGGSGKACDSCHSRRAYVTDRDFCKLCHGEPLITQ